MWSSSIHRTSVDLDVCSIRCCCCRFRDRHCNGMCDECVCVWGRMSRHCAELLEILWWVHLLVMVMVWYVHLVMCMQVQIRRFLIEYHIFIPTPVYARGLIILDEVAARVGGVSDKCAFVSHWRQGLLLCLCLCVALATRSLCCAFSALIGGRGSIYIDHSTLSYKIGGLVVRLL